MSVDPPRQPSFFRGRDIGVPPVPTDLASRLGPGVRGRPAVRPASGSAGLPRGGEGRRPFVSGILPLDRGRGGVPDGSAGPRGAGLAPLLPLSPLSPLAPLMRLLVRLVTVEWSLLAAPS